MSRYYPGQPEAITKLWGDAMDAEAAYLKSRFDVSQKVLSQILAGGGVTTSESDFTLAMHGFSESDLMGPGIVDLLGRYTAIRDQFGDSEERPVGEVVEQYNYAAPQVLHQIGRVPYQSSWNRDQKPLRYHIYGTVDQAWGKVELPAEQHHRWTENHLDFRNAKLTIQDEGTIVVASVQRTANERGVVYPPLEHAVDIASHMKVGWKAVIGSWEADEKIHGIGYNLFMDRIQTARAAFEQRHPAEIGAD